VHTEGTVHVYLWQEEDFKQICDGIRREFFLCLLWRRIHASDNGSIFIGRDFSGVKLS